MFIFTLWDVEHGLAITCKTPNQKNICVDAGMNSSTEFSPFEWLKENYRVTSVDLLIISHPDEDHIRGLPSLVQYLGRPKTLLRNKTLPDNEFGKGSGLECKKALYTIHKDYDSPAREEEDLSNPRNTGGVVIKHFSNSYSMGIKVNDTSLVTIFEYCSWAFVCPGDLEPAGWTELMKQYRSKFQEIRNRNDTLVLVAPHHGRPSAYNKDMIEVLAPDLVLISDKYGKHETAGGYYTCGNGLIIAGEKVKCLSTKTKGAIVIKVNHTGRTTIECKGVA